MGDCAEGTEEFCLRQRVWGEARSLSGSVVFASRAFLCVLCGFLLATFALKMFLQLSPLNREAREENPDQAHTGRQSS